MAIYTTYSKARANLANLLAAASEDKEVILINRRNKEEVALISSSELSSLMETAHLLRSPKNAQRLLTALNRALSESESISTLDQLKKELGFE
jgi:antitoxin YefM